jgi:cobalt-zinc-cadmium resistance protein CzcA
MTEPSWSTKQWPRRAGAGRRLGAGGPILYLFLGEIRSALVVIVTLPLAMLISFMLMKQWGLSANLMSLAGLAVGIGMMVDGAVVLVENGFRLLSHQGGKQASRTHIILEAAREVMNLSLSRS